MSTEIEALVMDLVKALKESESLALELMERAERIDAMLLKKNGMPRDCEIGEITRMRTQLSRNRELAGRIGQLFETNSPK